MRKRRRSPLSDRATAAKFDPAKHPHGAGGKFTETPDQVKPTKTETLVNKGASKGVTGDHTLKLLPPPPPEPGKQNWPTKGREGKRFAHYKTGMTVDEAVASVETAYAKDPNILTPAQIAAGGVRKQVLKDLTWAHHRGHLAFDPPSGTVATATAGSVKLGAPKLKFTKPDAASKMPEDDPKRWAAAAGVHDMEDARLIAGTPGLTINHPSAPKTIMHQAVERTGIVFTGSKNQIVNYYTASGAYKMNSQLRGGFDPATVPSGATASSTFAKKVQSLDRLIEKSKLQDDLIVYRGIGHSSETETIGGAPPPDFYGDQGFLSTSFNPRVSSGFAGTHEGKTTLLRIRLPKGTNAAFISRRDNPQSALGDEAEVLLPRGSQFRVVKRYEEASATGYTFNPQTGKSEIGAKYNVVEVELWKGPVPAGAASPISEDMPKLPTQTGSGLPPLTPLRARGT